MYYIVACKLIHVHIVHIVVCTVYAVYQNNNIILRGAVGEMAVCVIYRNKFSMK